MNHREGAVTIKGLANFLKKGQNLRIRLPLMRIRQLLVPGMSEALRGAGGQTFFEGHFTKAPSYKLFEINHKLCLIEVR